jgi:hypothetical protein
MVARKAMTIESILNRAPKENLLKERLTQLGRQRLFSMKGYRCDRVPLRCIYSRISWHDSLCKIYCPLRKA